MKIRMRYHMAGTVTRLNVEHRTSNIDDASLYRLFFKRIEELRSVDSLPVFVATSQSTREIGSCSKQASSTASDIWSQSLSGCPSVTDSEVNTVRGEVMNVRLTVFLLKSYAPSRYEKGRRDAHGLHLIFQHSPGGFGTTPMFW